METTDEIKVPPVNGTVTGIYKELFVASNTTEDILAKSIFYAVVQDGGCYMSLAGKWGAYRALKAIAIANRRLEQKDIKLCININWETATGRRDGDSISVIKLAIFPVVKNNKT